MASLGEANSLESNAVLKCWGPEGAAIAGARAVAPGRRPAASRTCVGPTQARIGLGHTDRLGALV